VTVTIPAEVPPLPLPPSAADDPDADWAPEVLDWYAVWAASDYAELFDRIDWHQLHRLAPMVNAYWSTFDPQVSKEIERSEEQLRRRTDGRATKREDAKPATAGKAPAAKPKREARKLKLA
jgi:hypothetical protein